MQGEAEARFSRLQNVPESSWYEAERRNMVAIIKDLEKAHYRAAIELTGFAF